MSVDLAHVHPGALYYGSGRQYSVFGFHFHTGTGKFYYQLVRRVCIMIAYVMLDA